MRTISQHISLMQHAVGGTPDSRHDLYQTFNRAGRILTRRRKWWWRLVVGASLPAVSGSTDIALPSDFDALDKLMISASQTVVQTITPDEYTRLLAGLSTAAPTGYKVLLPVMTYNATTGAETKVLKMLSAATATAVPTFTMTYYRGWFDVTSANDASYAHIPPDFDDALMLIARACALDLQDQMDSHEMTCYERECQQLERADSSRVPEFAPPTGGANDRRGWTRMDGPMRF